MGMNRLDTQWELRQIATELLSLILCATTFVIFVPCAIQIMKLQNLGWSGMYPDLADKKFYIGQILDTVWHRSLLPSLRWLPLTLFADVLIRRYVFGLRER